jgi:hypothetical protein
LENRCNPQIGPKRTLDAPVSPGKLRQMIRPLLLMLAASPLLCADPAPTEAGKKGDPFGPGEPAGPAGPAGPADPVEPKTLPAPDQPVAPADPAVKELDADRMQVGEVISIARLARSAFPLP